MDAMTNLTVTQALQALRSRDLSSEALTRAYLDRIERLEPHIHAYLHITAETALQNARAADERRASNAEEDLPPLLGLPIAVKDVLALAGMPCTCGSRILENFIPPYTATTVQRLLDAGVVVLGKTNTDEFAMGSSTENSAYQVTRNPWDLSRVPGGSSGGSAAAVAGRLAPIALGTDTGGSVRQPASFCGLTGIKPTYGRVSRYGLVAYGSSLDTVGLLANSAAEIALLFNHMAGPDPRDASTVDLDLPTLDLPKTPDLRGLRIGVPSEYFIDGMQPAVVNAVQEAVDHLATLGAEIIQISLPYTEYAVPVYYIIAPAEASANLARYDGIRFGYSEDAQSLQEVFKGSRGTGFGAEVKRRIMLGTYALSAGYYEAYYGQAQKVRTLMKRDFETAFEKVDLIAAPVAPTTAFKIGEHSNDPLAMYLEDVFSLPSNLAGIPGMAFPVGFDPDGLPIGMQFMGPHFREDLLFSVTHAYQLATYWHTRRPSLHPGPPACG